AADSEVGGIAQLGERLNGIQEVSGSIPLISTKRGTKCRKTVGTKGFQRFFFFRRAKFSSHECPLDFCPRDLESREQKRSHSCISTPFGPGCLENRSL